MKTVLLNADELGKYTVQKGCFYWRKRYEIMVTRILSLDLISLSFPRVVVSVKTEKGNIKQIAISDCVSGNYLEVEGLKWIGYNTAIYDRLFYKVAAVQFGTWNVEITKYGFKCTLAEYEDAVTIKNGMTFRGKFKDANPLDKKFLICYFARKLEFFLRFSNSCSSEELMDVICQSLEVKPSQLEDFQILFGEDLIYKISHGESNV